ncbi:NAD(P)H-hydrate dehydratase [Candidatus Acidulodesulfobacterium sp. H_13]|uniref:NAD(P)H-hydrate dehydratase n=1 Tax=Candidatus Acidulodesulfobacterium sp. H_13 TaxID=3395470 RepID=UPI003AF77728
MKLYFSENLKKIDEESYSIFGYSKNILMENAGGGCYREILKLYGKDYLLKSDITIICGKGNNGGDGFVLSRYLFNAGVSVKTVILANKNLYKGAAEENLNILLNLNSDVIEISEIKQLPILSEILDGTDILSDAIFGVGINREVTGFLKAVIEIVDTKSREIGFEILCIDVPSGLNADTGDFMGSGIKSNIKRIFTLGGLKAGFYVNESEKLLLSEKLTLIDINQPKKLLDNYYSGIEVIDEEEAIGCFTERKETGTKFDYGHLLSIAGSYGKTGAAYMSSYAGFKSGAGLVSVAVPAKLNDIMETKTTEIMTYPVFDDNKGFFVEESAADISENMLQGKTAVVIGPGIGLNERTKLFLSRLIRDIRVPMILDADALNILSENMKILKEISDKNDIVLTPHFKEMERLTGINRRTIEKDPLNIGKNFAKEFGVYLVLKGSSMFIFDKNGENVSVQCAHCTLLASGGSGDVLSGIIGSFICQGMNIYKALKAASFLMVYSANNLKEEYGDFGAGAVKIAENIPKTINLMKVRHNKNHPNSTLR